MLNRVKPSNCFQISKFIVVIRRFVKLSHTIQTLIGVISLSNLSNPGGIMKNAKL